MKKIITALVLITAFGLGACTTTVTNAKQDNPLKIWFHNESGAYETLCVKDDKTNVNYVVVATEVGNGHRSIAITPRYNADGTLYVD